MNIASHLLPFAAIVAGLNAAYVGVDGVAQRNFPSPVEGSGVVMEPVAAGSDVLVDWQIIKRTECPGENARDWRGVGGFHLTEQWAPTTLPATEEPRSYRIETHIPDLAPPGELELRIVGYYQCAGAPRVNFELGPVVMQVIE